LPNKLCVFLFFYFRLTNEDHIQTNKFKSQYLNSLSQFDLSKYTDPSNSQLKTRIYNDLINFLNNLNFKVS
jgi:hypothetical protein